MPPSAFARAMPRSRTSAKPLTCTASCFFPLGLCHADRRKNTGSNDDERLTFAKVGLACARRRSLCLVGGRHSAGGRRSNAIGRGSGLSTRRAQYWIANWFEFCPQTRAFAYVHRLNSGSLHFQDDSA